MGNKSSTEYSLEKFVTEFKIRDMHNIPNSDIKNKLEMICAIFRYNKNYYKMCKNEEDKINGQNENEEDDIKESDVNSDDMRKTKKFCFLISFMIKLNFNMEFHDNYLMILEIMGYLVKEKEFLKCFMLYSTEHLCNMVTTNSTFSKQFYREATKLFIEILEIIKKDSKFISENLSGLRKIMIVPKKIIDITYCKDPEVKLNLLKILKINLYLMRNLNETSKKDKTFIKIREYSDFVSNTIVRKF